MAVRRWKVQAQPETGMVDRTDLFDAVADAVVMLDRAGGVMSCVVERAPTDLPGEMVTTLAVVTWQDRTDAKPQPERATGTIEHDEQPGLFEPTAPDVEDPAEVLDAEPPADVEEPEEDVSEIPAHMR